MINLTEVNLDLETTLCIVGAMKEMANIDNELHDSEKQIIDGFVKELENEYGDIGTLPSSLNLSLMDTPEKQMLLLQCVTYVALADEKVAEEERNLLNTYIRSFSLDVTPQDLIQGIGRLVLSRYRGITLFADKAIELGKTFGLSEEQVNSIITE